MALDHSPAVRSPASTSTTVVDLARRALRGLREFQAAQVELHERVMLRRQPWLEELMHWSCEGGEWRLHGSRPPLPDARRRSVTANGWCPDGRGRDGS